MKSVIFEAPSQSDRVKRLVDHCKALGSDLEVMWWGKDPFDARYPDICNAAFLWTARQMTEPFIWLEADSIPLREGWDREIEIEYLRGGKPIMMSIDQQTPFDLIGGIGVYDPETVKDKMPSDISWIGWDGWLIEYRPDLVHRSEVIQHSYARYDHKGDTHDWVFPRDKWIIRKSSAVFHRDRAQGLIEGV